MIRQKKYNLKNIINKKSQIIEIFNFKVKIIKQKRQNLKDIINKRNQIIKIFNFKVKI